MFCVANIWIFIYHINYLTCQWTHQNIYIQPWTLQINSISFYGKFHERNQWNFAFKFVEFVLWFVNLGICGQRGGVKDAFWYCKKSSCVKHMWR